MTDDDKNFVESALQHNYITQENIDECCKLQEKLPGQVPIRALLREKGHMDESQCQLILTMIKYKGASDKEKKPQTSGIEQKSRDREFAEVLIHSQLISYDQVAEAIDIQKSLTEQGQSAPLANVLISKKYLWADGEWENWTIKEEMGDYSKILLLISTGIAYLINKKMITIKPIGKTEITIGRVAGANLIVNETVVSRTHAKITFDPDIEKWEIVDMMSSLGTLVNDEKTHKHTLRNNDVITIGTTHFQVKTI